MKKSTTSYSAPSNDLTPLMRQYLEIKERNPDTILLYRMGDFYELFFEDAKIAANVLGLTLTSRNHGGAQSTPLAGFPYHALDRYANRLVRAGYKIAVCEQTEDPKAAKGIVKRDVVEVITAGTATEDNFIEERANNYILSLFSSEQKTGVAICDLSTGLYEVEEIDTGELEYEIVRIDPSELLLSDANDVSIPQCVAQSYKRCLISKFDSWKFSFESANEAICSHFNIASVQAMGLEGFNEGVCAAGALLSYLKEQKKSDLKHISSLKPRALSQYAELDPSTIRNLELLKPMQTDDKDTTLVSVLDRTGTAMGARLLRTWITHPLQDLNAINGRLDCVEWLKNDIYVRSETELLLKRICDLERLISRVMFERANARDLLSLAQSFDVLPSLIKVLEQSPVEQMALICSKLHGFATISKLISSTIEENPPLSVKEGGIIKKGINEQLDEIRDASLNGKQWIASLQETERQRTKISSLKVGYNKVFGYYIEVSKANKELVPDNYIRKQTLVNGERFITPELKDMEAKVLGAQEKLNALEFEVFTSLRKEVSTHCERIQKAASALATLDVYVSLARIAADYAYTRPVITNDCDIIIKEGRHPVVERMNDSEQFVPNDTEIISGESQLLLITGPNMAGKSTYLRQNALITIMAQLGSFVPAQHAQIGVVDKFFTRVGASDRLARGQSTFLVEMIEVANILNNTTNRSLIILDEVGRGTSTFDGISIAWAVAEFLHETDSRRGRTLFATHYHELTEMPLLYSRIKNLHIRVKEWNDKIIFLRKIENGSCDHSYGIQVARLAGVPQVVINRAREILTNLENMELTPDHKPILARKRTKDEPENSSEQTDLFDDGVQLNLMDTHTAEIMATLHSLDINGLTPLDALNILSELKAKSNSEV
ncbi:DNA mismatch repair protein MutS [Chitinispirillales bacterium ANBcel5]|uniref:DNA mismatch repair protein MutS n=1 Tax=Cellulosispirillum alkaliphilum TaxID=3039283 RepID=UPI002A5212CA|nr:DNA mismatch repair protein MutS [Chitinispirillales bacterium ANBcel5]